MAYIFLGFFAFVFFVLYDINSVLMKRKFMHKFFLLGCIMLAISTLGVIVSSRQIIHLNLFSMIFFGFIALIFLLLLIYTLFFALPFKETYIKAPSKGRTYKKGVYALCRHPGLLWFMGFYLFLWLALKIPWLLVAGIVFSIGNVLYIIFQDKWTFLYLFDDYNEYKKQTPFLIPNFKSIRQCIKTLRQERVIW